MCSQFSLVAFVGILACHLETNRAHVGMFLKEADLNQIIIYQTLKFFFALFPYISLGHYLASDIQFQTKIQQTKMLVTCQRFGICFYIFGLVWQYSSVQTKYDKGRFKVMAILICSSDKTLRLTSHTSFALKRAKFL